MDSTAIANLALVGEFSRLLHDQRPFSLRLKKLFQEMRAELSFRDIRLTCWFQSARQGSLRQQFFSPDPPTHPWDNQLMRRTAVASQMLCCTVPNGAGRENTYVGLPIRWNNQLWGVLELRKSDREPITQEVQELLAALAPQFATAIAREGTRLSQQEPASQLQALGATGTDDQSPDAWRAPLLSALEQEIQNPQPLQKLLTLLLRWSLDETGAEAGAICLVDSEHGELLMQVYEGYPAIAGTEGTELFHPRAKWTNGIAGRVARTGRALLVRDVMQEDGMKPVTTNLRAELAAPIRQGERVLAVLVLSSPRSAAFGESELAFVNALCERAAVPLSQALYYHELVERSVQLGQVFSSLPTGLALFDTNGRVLRTNQAWDALWGIGPFPPERPAYLPHDLVAALLDRLPNPLALTTFCTQGQQSPEEMHMANIHLSNPDRELSILAGPTRDSLGQLTGRFWMVSDVTHERELDRLKNEFVSIVSHELRTPLTSILGFTELLLARDFTPSEQRQFIQTVYDQANHLSQLVEDLLSASRIESGKITLNRWMVRLQQVIVEIINQLGTLEHHRMLIRMVEPLPMVYIDRDKIKQVLLNLITNAIKYSYRGTEIEIIVRTIGTEREEEEEGEKGEEGGDIVLPPDHPPGLWVVVSVRDQGIGIAAEDLPRIWEKFYRVDNTNTRRIGGVGLGLHIVRSLVELHGGRIWAESVVGEGSTFSFTLPTSEDQLVTAEETW